MVKRADESDGRSDESSPPNWDYVALGLTVLDLLGRPIDVLPASGDVTLIEEIRMTPAGTAAGPAVIAAKLGLRSRLLGAVGVDETGDALVAGLVARGVDVGAVQRVEALRTSATLLTIHSNGERPAFHAPGASLLLARTPEIEETVTSTRFLHVGGIGTLPQLDGRPLAELLEMARASGALVTADLIAPGGGTPSALAEALPHIDWFMPTLDEALEISSCSSAEEAGRYFMDRGAGGCVFKNGSEGSLLVVGGEGITKIPALPVEAVDTTGCGDAYCAGFAAGLAHAMSPLEAAHLASATAALVATGLGSDAGVQSFAETRKFAEKKSMRSIPQRRSR